MTTRRSWVLGLCGGLLVASCAADVGERSDSIVNGRVASGSDLHGTVAIAIGGVGAPEELDNCTGTLIRPNVVLTAAHCFFQSDIDGNPTTDLEPISRFSVIAGALSVFRVSADQTYGVTRFAVHPSYDNLSGTGADLGAVVNDIALVVTDRNVEGVEVVPFLEADRRAELVAGLTVTISGYGATRFEGEDTFGGGNLMIAEVEVDSLSSTEVLLYRDSGEDTCPGDSGGPVYHFVDGRPRVVGITSRADPMAVAVCGDGGIYTLPHAFEAWVDGEVGPPMMGDGGGCVVSPASISPTPALLVAALGLLFVRRRA